MNKEDYDEDVTRGHSRGSVPAMMGFPVTIQASEIQRAMQPILTKLATQLEKRHELESTELRKSIADQPKPESIDIDALAETLAKAVASSVVVKHETINKAVTSSVELPQDVSDLIKGMIATLTKAEAATANRLDDYKAHDQDESAALGYFGFVHPSGAWYIMRNNATLGKQRYAAGTSGYESAWDKRANQDYTYLSEAMK